MDVQHTKRLISLSKDTDGLQHVHHKLAPTFRFSPHEPHQGMKNKLRHVDSTTVMLQMHRFQQQKQATEVKALAIQTKWLTKHFKKSPNKKPRKDDLIEPKNAVKQHIFQEHAISLLLKHKSSKMF